MKHRSKAQEVLDKIEELKAPSTKTSQETGEKILLEELRKRQKLLRPSIWKK